MLKTTMLITLKTFQKISNLSYHSGYDSTRAAFELILGKVPTDLSDITEAKGLEVVSFMQNKLDTMKKDKSYVSPKPVEAKGQGRGRFGLEEKKKKKVIVIE